MDVCNHSFVMKVSNHSVRCQEVNQTSAPLPLPSNIMIIPVEQSQRRWNGVKGEHK
jgi:hypothetical protein